MKKSVYTLAFVTLFGVLSAPRVFASPDINNPMTRAVLQVYEEQLKENPTDYHIWLNRANEYYRSNEYMRALNDVDNALKYMPAKAADDRIMALMLRANIYIQTDRPEQALNDLNQVISLDSNNYVALYQRANIYYSTDDFVQSKTDYQRLMRLNSRSPEALVGLARIAVKEDNLGMANDYLEQAVNNDPSNSELYVRRATVRRDMGNHAGAVDDLILALAVDSRNNKAVTMLVDYGNTNYQAVFNGLTNAMNQAPKVGMYPYLRAAIAQHNYHYNAALKDYRLILDKKLYDYQGIWRAMAECLYCMGRFEDALADVDHALQMDPNAAEAALLRAKILRALGRYDEAKQQAAKASVMSSKDNINALNEMGLVYIDLKEYQQAADLFAETTMSAKGIVEQQKCYMLRAWVLGTFLNQPVAATGFYERVADLANENPSDPVAQMYGAFGVAYAGDTTRAVDMANRVLAENPEKPYVQYLGTCFFTQMDDFDRALEVAKKAIEDGYADYYNWEYESDARVNVAPLRNDLRFLNLLDRNKSLWE